MMPDTFLELETLAARVERQRAALTPIDVIADLLDAMDGLTTMGRAHELVVFYARLHGLVPAENVESSSDADWWR